jgi:LL-diaminopimelate aminotransferase
MIKINENYLKLQASYLFIDINQRTAAYMEKNPEADIIKLGIGDVTRALPQACIEAFHAAVDEMSKDKSFRGYGPEQGYDFLRNAIAENDFASRGIDISSDEIYVSDGAKCDSGNIQELFSTATKIAVPDPVYPVYVDTNVMAGRGGDFKNGRFDGLVYLESTAENGFVPAPPAEPVDLIYLCFPNNPTGATATRAELQSWVDYARRNKSLILFDAAYETFIRDESLPRSIFEIDGADEVAIEFRSFSKHAGFTGTRCAFTVIPKSCVVYDSDGAPHPVGKLWVRRQTTKFNGVSYPVQRAAEAVYTQDGQSQVRELSDYYLENAAVIRSAMSELGYTCAGGDNSPYVWANTGGSSWEFFDALLEKASVICTPGSGFGTCGEGYIRLSAFNSKEKVVEAMERIVDAGMRRA